MENTFLTELNIRKVRHLKNINIPISRTERKNLILTGKNGSGKTSVLESLTEFLLFCVSNQYEVEAELVMNLAYWKDSLKKKDDSEEGRRDKEKIFRNINMYEEVLLNWTEGCPAACTSFSMLREKYKKGEFILAAYSDKRELEITSYKNIEKVDLKQVYTIKDKPSKEFAKYLADQMSTQAFAEKKKDFERAKQIEDWFVRIEEILRMIYKEKSLKLDFDIDTYQFSILIDGREPFSFDTMSMGYAAAFEIVSDLIMRMELHHRYDMEGIVLIDEIETHLHVELQKEIVPILTKLFPNIQFILTTHSPFVLNSTPNAVVYDLEKKLLVEDGLTNLPYEGVIEGYFDADLLSQTLREKFEQYKTLLKKKDITDKDYAKIVELETYLDEVPDYLALDFATEYSRLKCEFEKN